VAPQVWAWRSGRLRKLAARTDRIAVVLPFEETFYRAAGVSVDAVGHPILDRPVATRPVADARRSARHALGIDPGVPVIGFYPGSRRNEIARHLPLQFEAIERLVADRKDLVALEIVIAVAPSIDRTRIEGIAKRFASGRKLHFVTDAMLSMDAIDVALAKPGTVTLELLLRERPMVVMARTGRLTGEIVRRGLNVSYLALPNLIAEAEIVPECIQDRATPDRIASALAPLLGRALGGRDEGDEECDGAEMNALSRAALDQVEAMREARTRLGESGATDRAAAIAEELLGTPRT
jgi:lipid-A-disaccharide synthase